MNISTPGARDPPASTRYKIAVLVPCYNEEVAVAQVVTDFRAALPSATIFVFDNNSTDNTVAAARAAGAEVFREQRPGQGLRGAAHVHRRGGRYLRAGGRRRHL